MKQSIKELPEVDRPREKLVKYGPGKLSDAELLSILLRTGKVGLNVIELAKKILKKFGDELPYTAFSKLRKTSGIGKVKACEIIACFELGKRLLKGKKTQICMSPTDIWNSLIDLRARKKEYFVIFYFDTQNQEIKRKVISVGTLNANLVHPREVFEPAVRNLAAQIIIAHNHPSGNLKPSDDDLKITKKLVSAGKILGIEVIDHIIVTKKSFLSFKEKKII